MPVPPITLAARLLGTSAVVKLDTSQLANQSELTAWPEFHNGCAAALRVQSGDNTMTRYMYRRTYIWKGDTHAHTHTHPCAHIHICTHTHTHVDTILAFVVCERECTRLWLSHMRNPRAWIHSHKPEEPTYSHAGLLFGFGLTGKLKALSPPDIHEYLHEVRSHYHILPSNPLSKQ